MSTQSSDPKFFIERRKITQKKNCRLFSAWTSRTLPKISHVISTYISYDKVTAINDSDKAYLVQTHKKYEERYITLSDEYLSRIY